MKGKQEHHLGETKNRGNPTNDSTEYRNLKIKTSIII